MLKPLLFNPAPHRILVVTMRYLGDTLLVTPLLNSLKKAYPQAQIDVLVFENTAAILEGNPAIANIIRISRKPDWRQHLALFKQIFRRYDLAVATQAGDRPALYSFLAAPVRIGLVPQKPQTGWFKRYLYQLWLEFDVQKTHTVLEILRLCQLLAIEPCYELTPPATRTPLSLANLSPDYVVLHPFPQWRYKQWTQAGWIAVANYCQQQGLQVVLSGSGLETEQAYLQQLLPYLPADTVNLAGKLSLAALAELISHARLFVGVDTGITHLASATGVATLALFGPSDPVKWTPWPVDYHSDKPPFVTKGNQRVNNVTLLQGNLSCVPCYLEGCERHRQSYSACLDSIRAEQVIMAMTEILSNTKPC